MHCLLIPFISYLPAAVRAHGSLPMTDPCPFPPHSYRSAGHTALVDQSDDQFDKVTELVEFACVENRQARPRPTASLLCEKLSSLSEKTRQAANKARAEGDNAPPQVTDEDLPLRTEDQEDTKQAKKTKSVFVDPGFTNESGQRMFVERSRHTSAMHADSGDAGSRRHSGAGSE